jgi:carbonic anhydrase
MVSILSLIQQKQLEMVDAEGDVPPHEPEMLLIGCVDARKDIINDLGIPRGKALILRNVAALVHPESHRRLTESAALAFAVREMKVKHVAVMGHTDCGGIRAALEGVSSYSLRDYLAPIKEIRDDVHAQSPDRAERRYLLEQEAVKYSVRSLRTYDYIAAAEAEGRLTLHGWVLDIVSGRLHEWDEESDEFVAMGQKD